MLNLEQDITEQAEAILRERVVEAAEQATEAAFRHYISEGHVKSWDMVKSIYYVIDRHGIGFKIVVPVFYARFLEFGTKRQPARFPLQTAVRGNIQNTIDIMSGEK